MLMPRTSSTWSSRIAVSMFFAGVLVLLSGCADFPMSSSRNSTAEPSGHPMVRIIGADGTVLDGQLLNGSVTVECGQGTLTLLTDHINTISINSDADVVESNSVKLAGKIKDQQFLLKNEHGVFTLMKDRLHKIDFGIPSGGAPSPQTPATTYSKPAMARDGQQ
jgi:hypothetical protein